MSEVVALSPDQLDAIQAFGWLSAGLAVSWVLGKLGFWRRLVRTIRYWTIYRHVLGLRVRLWGIRLRVGYLAWTESRAKPRPGG